MSVRDLLAIVTSQAGNEHVIALAEQLATQSGGRLTVALVNWMPSLPGIEGFSIAPIYDDLVKQAQERLERERTKLEERFNRSATVVAIETFMPEFGAAGSTLGMRARHADLTVVARPDKDDASSARAILDASLFESGRPVIVVPPDWQAAPVGRHVLVAWKPTREAARALGDADEMITAAERVSVVTVEANPSRGYGEQPGADIAARLAFRGAKVELFNLDSGGRSETRTILDQALLVGADLIVMGGYGRPRLSELVFGGVTREMLHTAKVPVLMSH
ncbi:MAG: universal stress protein [Hyphomonadaceae bacterium]|nr:universal stress protein [Hyphomonadaceae bacterium]